VRVLVYAKQEKSWHIRNKITLKVVIGYSFKRVGFLFNELTLLHYQTHV